MSREQQLIDFLSKAESYPYKPEYIKIIQTHISIIAIAPPYVYKFKKSINFGFIDYSSLEKRRQNVFKEFTLNKRLCDEIYEEIIKVYIENNRFSFEKGELFEYGIKMKYLKTENCLQEITKSGRLTQNHIELLANCLRGFYKNLKPDFSGFGSAQVVQNAVLDNFKVVNNLLDEEDLFKTKYIYNYSTNYFDTHKEFIQKRLHDGWIRDCHGDLRLEHIYLQNSELNKSVCIYDCIEFNDNFRFIDIASDLAFLAMDLDYHEKPRESNRLAKLVLLDENDSSLRELFRFYKCYRAYVRVKVNMLRASEPEVPDDEKKNSINEAKKYLALCFRYALLPEKPVAILVMGKVGTGKTTVARYIADSFTIPHLNSDYIRKSLAQLDPYKPSCEEARKELYSPEQTQKTYNSLLQKTVQTLKQGSPAVIDATFSKKEVRKNFMEAFHKEGFSCIIIETTTNSEIIESRLKHRPNEKNNTSDATHTEKELMDASYEPPTELQEQHRTDFMTVDTSSADAGEWQEALFHCLKKALL
ncbi:MAG: AAA family ATPase [Leptospirales bacterium]